MGTLKEKGRFTSIKVDKHLLNKRRMIPNSMLSVKNVLEDEVSHWFIFSDSRVGSKKSVGKGKLKGLNLMDILGRCYV